MNKNLESNTVDLLEEGVKELVIREGKAADLFNPRTVSITGILAAPRQFLSSSKIDNYDQKLSHVLVDQDNKSIILKLHETDHHQHVIEGRLTTYADLDDLEINTGNKLTHRELVQLLKKYKFYFADVQQHSVFLHNMENFKAKVTKQIEDVRQNNGNRSTGFNVIVENAMKDAPTFDLLIPLFKGYPKVKFTVEVCLDATDANVVFYFESQDLFQLEKELAEKYIGDELVALDGMFKCSQVFTS